MYKLARNLIILFLPLIIFIILCVSVGLYVGDMYPLNYIAKLQTEDHQKKYNLIGPRVKIFEYKFESILAHDPKILVLGSSRAWYFNDYFANRCPHVFYNASVPRASIFENELLLESIIEHDHIPNVILLNLDYPEYNAESVWYFVPLLLGQYSLFDQFADNIKRSIVYVVKNPTIILEIFNSTDTKVKKNIGWDFSKQSPSYYDSDGSYIPDYVSKEYATVSLARDKHTLINGDEIYQPGKTTNPSVLASLKRLLDLSSKNNIIIIGFLPPYHSEILKELLTQDRFEYISVAEREIQNIFDSYEYPLYNFSDVSSVNGNDEGLFDSWHSGELLSLQIYRQLLINNPEILSKYSDLEYLDMLIANATDPFKLDVDPSALVNHSDC